MPDKLFEPRRIFPERDPEVCVNFFTCAGINAPGTADLQRTYPGVLRYFEAQLSADAKALRYEFVWLDNGGDAAVRDAFVRRGAQFDVLLHNPSNEGLFRAVNDVRKPSAL